MKFLVFGSLNIDHVYRLDHLVGEGETVSSISHEALAGGKGLNQAIALARAGSDTYFAGAIGTDGLFLKETLDSAGVDTEALTVTDKVSGHAVIQVDARGRNAIIVCGGANHTVTPDMIDTALAGFTAGDFLVMQNEISSGETLLKRASARGMKVVLNPSPSPDAVRKWSLELADWLIFNEIEGQALSGETEPEKMLDSLSQRCPKTRMVLTLGKRGAILKDARLHLSQGAFPVNAVDTTAAGDTFTGYFLSALDRDMDEASALKIACLAASISVTRKGAAPSIPYWNEVAAAIK